MKRWMQAHLTIFGRDPRGRPVYMVKSKRGTVYEVRRVKFVAPSTSWAWRAEPAGDGKTLHADTLEDLLGLLGHEEPPPVPGSTEDVRFEARLAKAKGMRP